MFQKLICSIFFIMLLSVVVPPQRIQAEPFSIVPTQDGHVCNDTQYGPDVAYSTSGLHIRNIDERRRVGYVMYDISELKGPGRVFSNVSLSNYGHDGGDVLVYGIIEELDELFVDLTFNQLTWNSVPAGVQNDPTPAVDSPVTLDYADLTDILLTFNAPAKGTRESTETSQALADFLNSDTDGIIVLLLAPAEEGDNAIVRTVEIGADGGTLLEGDVGGLPKTAYEPNPADEEVDVPRDVVLSWTPGGFADTHNVYFGTVFDDVKAASIDNPMGVLVSQDQDPNIYDPDGLIEFGQTYYWRIDEVNDAHPDKLWKGEVWSFTAEPFAYPLENITATASSNEPGQEPADALTLEGDLHPTDLTQMWLSGQSEPAVAWINFEFDKVYKLHNMWVWNYNGALLNVVYGIKDASIDYLFNGTDYMPLGIYEFARATGANDYAHDDYSSNPSGNNEIDLSDVIATDIRITANSNWSSGLVDQYGLSEVRIFYVPVRARESQPASGQAGVALDAVLSWRVGREAVSHEVYFSSDMQAVIDGTALIDTVSQSSYALGPPGLELGKTYYWKVNEVNEAEIPASWEGEVWSFNAQEYLVVEDFEQYDDVCNRVFYTWVDGFGHSGYSDCGVEPYDGNVTGSTVGNLNAPFAERSIVNSGRQSMPLEYNNSAQPYYSETQRQWAVAQDLTRGGANSLTVWFYGDSGNTAEVLYVAVEDSAGNITVVSHTQPEAVQAANWQEWNIQLTDFAGVDPSSVKKIYIGVGNRAAPQSGGAGKLYIDDIRLYP